MLLKLSYNCSFWQIEGDSIFEPKAIQFCAAKVAAMAGDVRVALDICRRAVETVEAEVRHQKLVASEGKLQDFVAVCTGDMSIHI